MTALTAPTPENRSSRRPRSGGLSREALDTLWKAYAVNRDIRLRNRIVEHYIGLPRTYAENLKARLPNNIDVNDLIAAGHMGLIDAVEKYNPERGVKFETFCSRRINGAMFDELRRMDWVPRTIRQFISKYMKAQNKLIAELGRPPRDKEVADHLGLSMERYRTIIREVNTKTQISFDSRASSDSDDNDDFMSISRLVDNREPNPVDVAQRKEFIEKVLRGLNAMERTVVIRYYIEHATMKEIGDELKVSESRICQINAAVLKFLRQKFEGKELQLL